MNRTRHALRIPRGHHRVPVLPSVLAAVVVAILMFNSPASAHWSTAGSGSALVATGTLASPVDVTVPVDAISDVDLSWSPGAGGVPPDGYYVTRTAGSATHPACASSPTVLIATTACTDIHVADGDFRYSVTAVHRSWTATSAPSAVVNVAGATALVFTAQPADTIADGSVIPAVSVTLTDRDGDTVAQAGVAITVTISNNPSGGVLAGTLTVNTDSAGTARFVDLSINRAGVGYTLTAAGVGLTPAASNPFTVSPPPLLGAARTYSVLAVTAVVNTGPSIISGDLGVDPGTTVTGFPPGTVGGTIHTGDTHAQNAQAGVVAAYQELAARAPTAGIAGDLGGRTVGPGVHHSSAALALTGVLTLDAGGNPDAVFVFQVDAALNTAAGSSVNLIGAARAGNVFWVVAGAVGTGANSSFAGAILAQGAITLGASGTLIGQALSRGTVTLSGNTIRFTSAPPPTLVIDGGAAVTSKDTTPTVTGTSNASAGSAVTVTVAGQTLATTLGADGSWSVTAGLLSAGTHTITARVRDVSMNSAAAQQQLTVEVNPPGVPLGSAATYSVLAGTGVVSTGVTELSADLGTSPSASVTGFPPGHFDGSLHAGDPAAATAQSDLLAAIGDASTRAAHTEFAGDLNGRTFHIGVHHTTAALALTGILTLDAEGDPDAVFIFQTDAAFNTAAGSTVRLVNSAQAANVIWMVAGAAGTGADSTLAGTILARGAITLGASTQLIGQALSRGTVTLAGNRVTGTTGTAPGPASAPAQRAAAADPTEPPTMAPSSSTPMVSNPAPSVSTVPVSTVPPTTVPPTTVPPTTVLPPASSEASPPPTTSSTAPSPPASTIEPSTPTSATSSSSGQPSASSSSAPTTVSSSSSAGPSETPAERTATP